MRGTGNTTVSKAKRKKTNKKNPTLYIAYFLVLKSVCVREAFLYLTLSTFLSLRKIRAFTIKI